MIHKLSAHPTSTRVSEQLTKINESLLPPTHMVIILFPVLAGIKFRICLYILPQHEESKNINKMG